MEEVILMGYITREKHISERVIDPDGICFTGTGFAGNVWDTEGLAPTISTMGGNREPLIMESYEYKTCQDIEKQ